MATQKRETALTIKQLEWGYATVPIVGVTELICDNWGISAIDDMENKITGRARPKRDPADPEARYEASLYRLPDGGYGFPCGGFKAAIVDACRSFEGITMVAARTAITVEADAMDTVFGKPMVRIVGDPRMRRDVGANSRGERQLRYRAGFPLWAAELRIRFDPNAVPQEVLVNLINAAGRGGIGNWRPNSPKSKSGWAGTFRARVQE